MSRSLAARPTGDVHISARWTHLSGSPQCLRTRPRLAIEQDARRWTDMIHSPVPGPMRKRIKAQVGHYAAERQTDFVAEVYHGSMVGRTYPSEVMALCNQLGGPRL
jgi:hypothetical protein